MKIPKQFPQFENQNVLFMVTGKEDAIFYSTHDGTMEKTMSFVIPKPQYSDRESYVRIRSHGMVMRSGSVREINDDQVIKDFVHEFKQRIKGLDEREKITKAYLFAPDKTKNKLKKILPRGWKNKTTVIRGNYNNHTPLSILKKVAVMAKKPVYPDSPEAVKILKKPRQSRKTKG